MNKVTAVLCALALTVGLVLPSVPASAADNTNAIPNVTVVNKNKEVKPTTWIHDGIEITVFDTHTLTGKEKQVFEQKAKKEKSVKGEIIPGPSVEEPVSDFSAITLYGPTYRTYDNTVTVWMINTVVTFVSKQVETYVASSGTLLGDITAAAANTFFDMIKDYVKDHQYTYEGVKMTKAWSNYYGSYMYYITDVRYDDQYHSHVISVYYYNTGIAY